MTGCSDAIAPEALGIDDLRDLMQAMTQTTERLRSTHAALRDQVARLQRELAEANAQLRRSRSLAALGEMAAGIAHEVRNPLGSIQLYVRMLADDLADQPEPRAICQKIGRAVEGLDGIVADVLTFARDTVVRPTPITAGHLLDEALASCEALRRRSEAEVVRQGDPECTLEADGPLLTQALGNVVRNALEAMLDHDAPARLTLRCERRPLRCPDGSRAVRVVLAVQDTGPGLSEEAAQRMFNPFFTTRPTGTGLGLAIVHRIVDAHGGHVQVRNAPEGGACVELCVPPRVTGAGRADPGDGGSSLVASVDRRLGNGEARR